MEKRFRNKLIIIIIIIIKSRATHCVPIGKKGQLAIKFDRVEIAFILALFYGLKLLTDDGSGNYCSATRGLGLEL